ncbi:unnamed protein product [Musa hybrid cultivar]
MASSPVAAPPPDASSTPSPPAPDAPPPSDPSSSAPPPTSSPPPATSLPPPPVQSPPPSSPPPQSPPPSSPLPQSPPPSPPLPQSPPPSPLPSPPLPQSPPPSPPPSPPLLQSPPPLSPASSTPPTATPNAPPPRDSPPPPSSSSSPKPPSSTSFPPSSTPPSLPSSSSSSPPPPKSNDASSLPLQPPSPPQPISPTTPSSSAALLPPPPRSPSKSVPSHGTRPSPSKDSSTPSKSDHSGLNLPLVLGFTAGVGIFFVLMIIALVLYARNKKKPRQYYDAAGSQGGFHNAGSLPNWQNGAQRKDHNGNIPPPPGVVVPPGGGWQPSSMMSNSDISSAYSGPHVSSPSTPSPNISLGFNKNHFSYEELSAATNGFSRDHILGQGGFGCVYKGVLPNGKEVAVKQLKSGSGQGEREFQAEVEIISRVHHRHLVSLVGYCIAGSQRMLVYDFVRNKTLEFHLHGKGLPTMDWPTRLKIAIGSAKGLSYLHEDCHPRIIHRDIKTANILLDNNFEAMVADFGLAKIFSDTNTHVSTRIMGTIGYLAPEYASTGKLTEKSDVFSYGVMLLELITGRRPIDDSDTFMVDSLVDWARPVLAQALADDKFDELADPRLENSYDTVEMVRMVACAAACVRHSAKGRPMMSQIVRALDGDVSLEILNEGSKRGQSTTFSSSSDYDASLYSSNMKHFRTVALESNDYSNGYSGATSEYGLNPSETSSSGDLNCLVLAAEYSPFLGIEKGTVLQEARVFNDPQLDARRCAQVEATEVFFAVTKLFQSKDTTLRRMVYLIIKELSPSADEVIIVTSSLMKDMNSKIDMYRANAIRVLSKITDGTLLTQIERYLKQAIVDKNPVVASAALVSGIHLLQTNPEIVKRWSNEVQEGVQSRAALVQFHALALLHQIRQNDRLAVSKLVTSLTRGSVRSPLAQCLLIRYTSQVIHESSMNSQTGERPFFDYLESCLRHKAELVIFEAARAITELSSVTSRELSPAITVLQLFLSSSKPILRFAAVRTLNKVAMTHPLSVTSCNIDMESLISDQNRSIATLAITTLLKTGNESSVDRLMKQITNFMSDIADEFKIVVVEAIRSLCLKFPLKYRSLMNFLSNILREEGGFEYKKAIVDSIVILIRDIPDAKESGLFHLCEFIEDCEFAYLSSQILHFIGNEGPKTSDPSKYIRYIYNRVILENATVRASAVSTLAKFGAMVDSLKPRILVLLRRCQFDIDDEVRDRATLYLDTLGGDASVGETEKYVKDFLFCSLDVPLVNLEKSLRSYEASDMPFDIYSVPKEIKSQPLAEKKAPGRKPTGLGGPPCAPVSAVDAYEKLLSLIPEFSSFGKLFKSSTPVELSEAETEYAVNVVKHIYDGHVVFQYNCTNTIPEQLLENVTVFVDASEAEDFSEVASKPLRSLPYDSPGQTFVAFEKPYGLPATGRFSNLLKFFVKEVDPATVEAEEEGVEDEYQLEDLEIVPADYMLRVGISNFKNAWESMAPDNERVDEYGLGARESLAEAVCAVINILGMQPYEGTEVVPSNSRSHACLLSGIFIGNVKVLVRLSFGVDESKQVGMKLAVRSEDPNISERIHEIVAEA